MRVETMAWEINDIIVKGRRVRRKDTKRQMKYKPLLKVINEGKKGWNKDIRPATIPQLT